MNNQDALTVLTIAAGYAPEPMLETTTEAIAHLERQLVTQKGLQELRARLAPKFERYAARHNGERPCVEDLIDFMIGADSP